MSTGTWSDSKVTTARATSKPTTLVWSILRALGSLKITVTMFALGIVVLMVGTLAQDEETLVDVKNHYFNSWIAAVPFDVFLPITVFPDHERLPFVFPMPGGATVGLILLINLVAAKLTRFSMNAKGGRFVAGMFFTLLGFALVGLVVVGAHLGDGLQGEPPFSYDFLWWLCKFSVWMFCAASLVWALVWPPKTTLVKVVAWSTFAILASLAIFLLWTQDKYRIPDPGLRVTWQLSKSFLVAIVLMIGLVFLFGKRGGNVLIHFGVGLLMLGQFIFGDQQVEERMTILEGETTNLAYRIDNVELAIVDVSNSTEDKVMAVDHYYLAKSAQTKTPIRDASLPFDILVDQWMVNSDLIGPKAMEKNPATQGIGLNVGAIAMPKKGGADDDMNIASAYVTLLEKGTDKPIGTYLLSQLLSDPTVSNRATAEPVEIDGKNYTLQLRFEHSYKPYKIKLEGVQAENYAGTMTPRDYSSDVHIVGDDSAEQKGHIWMNNPLRFRGETFYQSSYISADKTGAGVEATTLQVVTNAGWLIPYVSCVICGLGMLVHFGGTFARFASRYERAVLVRDEVDEDATVESPKQKARAVAKAVPQFVLDAQAARKGLAGWLVPILAVALTGGYALKSALPPKSDKSEFDWYAAGQIPMQHEGRIKPADTVARNILQAISNRSTVYVKSKADPEKEEKIPATKWLFSVITDEAWVRDVECFRIEAAVTLDSLGLERRKGLRYSYNEVQPKMNGIREQLSKLDPRTRDQWTFEQHKLAQLAGRVQAFEVLLFAYRPVLPNMPEEDPDGKARERFQKEFSEIFRHVQMLENENPPAIIPPMMEQGAEPKPNEDIASRKWQAFGPALFSAFAARAMGMQMDSQVVLGFSDVLDALREQKPREFNMAVRAYRDMVAKQIQDPEKMAKASFEAWHNRFDPVSMCLMLYVVGGILCMLSAVGLRQPLRRSAFWVLLVVFILHTIAIVCRIYISGRAPVINLYSSAVFIGWAMVLGALIIELLYPIGLGGILGSTVGFSTLLVAYGLDTSDTMPVLQAVLDTQFWLATHVTTVALGYGATFLAGGLGIAFVVVRTMSKLRRESGQQLQESKQIEQLIYRICYGVVCFALFFSFVGTVLGGLWGDDSWGRFWGWDPKENGALMIVLWNAILLHARWDKLIAERGFSLLAIGGNIITAWSYFGTNQLGIGLHAYGGAELSVLAKLGLFCLSQLVVMVIGFLITRPIRDQAVLSVK